MGMRLGGVCELSVLSLESVKRSSPDFKSWESSWLSLLRAPAYPSAPICDIKDSFEAKIIGCDGVRPLAGFRNSGESDLL
jgi:hypothetical protein